MGKKNKKASDNPEVQAAIDERDALLAQVPVAVAKVDRLKDELLEEYRQANGLPREGDR